MFKKLKTVWKNFEETLEHIDRTLDSMYGGVHRIRCILDEHEKPKPLPFRISIKGTTSNGDIFVDGIHGAIVKGVNQSVAYEPFIAIENIEIELIAGPEVWFTDIQVGNFSLTPSSGNNCFDRGLIQKVRVGECVEFMLQRAQ